MDVQRELNNWEQHGRQPRHAESSRMLWIVTGTPYRTLNIWFCSTNRQVAHTVWNWAPRRHTVSGMQTVVTTNVFWVLVGVAVFPRGHTAIERCRRSDARPRGNDTRQRRPPPQLRLEGYCIIIQTPPPLAGTPREGTPRRYACSSCLSLPLPLPLDDATQRNRCHPCPAACFHAASVARRRAKGCQGRSRPPRRKQQGGANSKLLRVVAHERRPGQHTRHRRRARKRVARELSMVVLQAR